MVESCKRRRESDISDSNKRQRRVERRVRFSNSRREFVDNPFDALTDKELDDVKSKIWYTRHEFDEFLRDRVHTIRVWRSVGGEMGDLEEFYCLRGLEPYQSAALNAEMHSHRYLHYHAVLSEQAKQRREGTHAPERLATASLLSSFAMQRARRLALMDEVEVLQERVNYIESEQRSLKPRRRSSSKASSRRLSLGNSSMAASADVDIDRLKQMNAQFLRQMATCPHGKSPLQDSPTSPMSLTTLLLRRHKRRHSLSGVVDEASLGEDPFLAIRRDSLHGLQHT